MRKVSFRIRNFGEEQYLSFNLEDDDKLDEDLLNFLEDEEPRGLVPVIYEEEEEYDAFSYNISDKIHLIELSNQEINAEMVLMVMRSLVFTLIDMAEYRVPLSYLVLNRDYIYVDSDYQIEFICIPLENMQEEVNVPSFLRNFLASLRFEPSENGDYVARLFTYINNPAMFNLRSMVNLIDELMNNMDVSVPEENSAEIVGEYQEVDTLSGVVEDPEIVEDEEEKKERFFGDDSWNRPDEGEVPVQEMSEEPAGSVTEPEQVHEITEEPEPKKMSLKIAEPVEEPEEEPEKEPEEKPFDPAGFEEEVYVTPMPEKAEKAASNEDGILSWFTKDISLGGKDKAEGKQDKKAESKPDKKGKEKPADKKKNSSGYIPETNAAGVIQDELDEYLAEKEYEEEHPATHEDTGLRIKKNLKISRADIVKNTQEEQEEQAAEPTVNLDAPVREEKKEKKETPPEDKGKKQKQLKVYPSVIRVNTNDFKMINKQNFKIGTANFGVDFKIDGNKAVSRIHATITNKDGEYFIRDNKSTNHTYVNGEMLKDGEMKLLNPDTKFVLGDEEFLFKY